MTEKQYSSLINKYRNVERTINKNLEETDDRDGLLFSAIDEYLRNRNGFDPSPIKFDYLVISYLEKNKLLNSNYKNNLAALLLGCLTTNKIELIYSFILIIKNKAKSVNKKKYIDIQNINLLLLALSSVNPIIKWTLFLPLLIINTIILRNKGDLFSFSCHSCLKLLYKIDIISNSWYSKLTSSTINVVKMFSSVFRKDHPFTILTKENNKY